jgi:thiamine biosynthesis protein ThiI
VVLEERDALAAWMLMKRGCKATIMAPGESGAADILRSWDPKLRVVRGPDVRQVLRDAKALAAVYGYGLEDMEAIKAVPSEHPSFFPLVGMTEAEIAQRLADIKIS